MNNEELKKEFAIKDELIRQLIKMPSSDEQSRKLEEIDNWYYRHIFTECDDSCFMKVRLNSNTRTTLLFKEFVESDKQALIFNNNIFGNGELYGARIVVVKSRYNFGPSWLNEIKEDDGKIWEVTSFTMTKLKNTLISNEKCGYYRTLEKLLLDKVNSPNFKKNSNMIFFDSPIVLDALTPDGKRFFRAGGYTFVSGTHRFKIIGVRFNYY